MNRSRKVAESQRGGVPRSKGLRKKIAKFTSQVRNEKLLRLLFTITFVVIIGGGLVYLVEIPSGSGMFDNFAKAIWWGITTITTVGYGDTYPVTTVGRILASLVMLMGVVVTSVLSGTIASIFVDRKIREGKGLQDVVLRNHTVICGWNSNSGEILENFIAMDSGTKQVVLINEMDPEEFQGLKVHYESIDLRFVRGDFTNEKVLKRATVEQARAAVVVSDTTRIGSFENADERTILAVLAIKSINPDILTCAELLNQENEQHLRRAQVDDVIVNGEFSGFLLANATRSLGVPRLVREMMSSSGDRVIKPLQIPSSFIGKTFLELSEHLLSSGKGVLIGILSEEKKVSLQDMLSSDSSSIDAFIKRKFEEAEINIGEEESQDVDVHLSPPPTYTIKETDTAFVIGPRFEV
ncbi:MAG: NAD-binding protein [Spirochaetales bacterium]|nr:NAD-binding protein [Spirochaetales bacterium]